MMSRRLIRMAAGLSVLALAGPAIAMGGMMAAGAAMMGGMTLGGGMMGGRGQQSGSAVEHRHGNMPGAEAAGNHARATGSEKPSDPAVPALPRPASGEATDRPATHNH